MQHVMLLLTSDVPSKPVCSQDKIDVLGERGQYLLEENSIKASSGIIHLVSRPKYPKN